MSRGRGGGTDYLSLLGYSEVQRAWPFIAARDAHICALSPRARPDTSLRIPTHAETTQLVERLKVTGFCRYTSKRKESDTGATNSHKYVAPPLGIKYS